MALHTYNTTLKYGATSPSTTLRIKSFPSILGKRSSVEVTDLSDDAQTFIPGIRQQGESFDFTANYDPTVYAEINGLDAVQKCALVYSDGSGYTWDGKISASVNEGGVDAALEMTISITPETVPVWAQNVSTT
jgi:hypothetical protein